MTDDLYYPYSFEAPIERVGIGKTRKVWYTVLFLPDALIRQLPFAEHPRLRVDGEIGDLPVTGAWMPTRDGRRYFLVAAHKRKALEARVGQRVEMRFRVADQDAVDVPPELLQALAANKKAKKAWDALTPGKRRGMTHLIHAAKTAPTRERRVRETIRQLVADE